jgi:hypothetical protein
MIKKLSYIVLPSAFCAIFILFQCCQNMTSNKIYSYPVYIGDSLIGAIVTEYNEFPPCGDWGNGKYEDVKQSLWIAEKKDPSNFRIIPLQFDLPKPPPDRTMLMLNGKIFYCTINKYKEPEIWVYDTLSKGNTRFVNGSIICCASKTGKYLAAEDRQGDYYYLYETETKKNIKTYTNKNQPFMFAGDTAVILRSIFEPYTITVENLNTKQTDTISNDLRFLQFKLTSWHDFALVLMNNYYYQLRIKNNVLDTIRLSLGTNDFPEYSFRYKGDIDDDMQHLLQTGSNKFNDNEGCIYEMLLSGEKNFKKYACHEIKYYD